jgi:CRISPR-associated endonuclease/helicase Cas3/CRISPR-associated endonuclease Cas3-HD
MNSDELPDEIISRPGEDATKGSTDSADHELLVDHAAAVAERTTRLGRFESDASEDGPAVADISHCVGWLHDFGKVAPTFQLHVRGEYPDGEDPCFTYHARLGAFAAYYALGELGASERDRLAAWGSILRHHGRLPDFADATLRTVNGEQGENGHSMWAGLQVEHVRSHAPSREVASTLLAEATDGAASWDGFVAAFENDVLFDDLRAAVSDGISGTRAANENLPEGLYDRMTRLWSCLTFADKTVASSDVTAEDLLSKPLELDDLDRYVESLQEKSGADDINVTAADFDPTEEASLNVLREAARERVRENAPALLDGEVGTLTLPTGLGKTFAGITGAFELRDALAERRERETKPTVVYALPYTSIIEQTREIFEDGDVFDADPASAEFTVHHYLTETVTYTDSEGDATDGAAETDTGRSKAELLGESWRSGVVLTTFVQLFESLAGPTNRQGLKLPALQDAVIVLDEPQALPIRWWDAIRRLVRLLLDEYDARVVSMTATQPTLFTEGEFDTRSLLVSPDDEFDRPLHMGGGRSDASRSFERRTSEAVARVRYDVHESVRVATTDASGTPISHEAAAGELVDATRPPTDGDAAGRSVLAVCNTIGSSRELTECVEDEFRANGRPATHVGAVYETVLEETDSDSGELPNHEDLAARTFRRLGFEYDGVRETWRPSDDCSGRQYVATFNSRYRPLDRRVLVRVADVLSTADVPFVLVSTQAIEAGVDVSFARAYRDIAPLDSVVQTAGRCNRSFEWGPENGEVTVWTLGPVEDDEADGREPPSNYVYDGTLLKEAAEILLDLCDDNPGELSSVALERDAVPRYFDVIKRKSFSSEELVEMITGSRAAELGHQSLIDDGYETVDLIVAATEADRTRIEELGDAFERHASEGFERLSDLADLRVSIPVQDLDEDLPTHIRADRTERTDGDGVDVFVHRGNEGYGSYELDGGGFVSDDGAGPSGRFTL